MDERSKSCFYNLHHHRTTYFQQKQKLKMDERSKSCFYNFQNNRTTYVQQNSNSQWTNAQNHVFTIYTTIEQLIFKKAQIPNGRTLKIMFLQFTPRPFPPLPFPSLPFLPFLPFFSLPSLPPLLPFPSSFPSHFGLT